MVFLFAHFDHLCTGRRVAPDSNVIVTLYACSHFGQDAWVLKLNTLMRVLHFVHLLLATVNSFRVEYIVILSHDAE